MDTIIKKITGDKVVDNEIIKTAADIISRGGLVVFPTETVYGLGGDCYDPDAAEKIYAAKGRPSDNPLIVHISKIEDLYSLTEDVSENALLLAKAYWPGPLTMIFKKNDKVLSTVTGGLDTVAIRFPSHKVARELIAASGTYIAAPSANLSGRPSPTAAEHVIEDLSGRVDMIIDGGNIEIGLESTIVDMTEEIPVILRPGFITQKMLEDVVGEVQLDKALMTGVKGDIKPKAPGMKYRHYAPKAELTIFEGDNDAVIDAINLKTTEAIQNGLKVGIMISTENFDRILQGEKISVGSSKNEYEIAKNLFACLRKFDDMQVDVIFSEGFSEEGIGQAIMNRLLKAAGHKIINV